MRDPSIHITESQLKTILEDAGLGKDVDKLVKLILTKAYRHRLNHRKLLVNTKKDAKKAESILSSSTSDTTDMNKALLYVRRSLKHRGITPIRPGTAEYTRLKTLTQNGKAFYEAYFDKSEKVYDAFVQYLELGIKSIRKYSLSTLTSKHEMICSLYEAKISIASDPNPEYTQRALKAYNRQTIEQAGTLFVDYAAVPDKYVYFIEIAKLCKKHSVSPETYITAQFEGLKWANAIPEPQQMVTPKGLEYLQKYLYKNPEKLNKTPKTADLANKFKQLKSRSNGSD